MSLRIALIVILIVIALLIGASNYLIDFAFNPSAPFTMKKLIDAGNVDGVDLTDYAAGDPEIGREVKAWFAASKQSVSLTTEDGTELLGWQIPAQDTSSHLYTILCHGYTGTPNDLVFYAHHFFERDNSVLLPAARAHERNSATGYIQMGYQDSKDLLGWINQIVASDAQARIVVLGTSMGGAEVMMLSGWALPRNVVCIIEDCGYTSVWEELTLQLKGIFHLPSFPLLNITSFFNKLRAGYDFKEASSLTQLKKATVPMLFIHGDADTFVPASMLQKNYDACASTDKKMLMIKGAGHCLSSAVNPELYWSTVDTFIDEHI